MTRFSSSILCPILKVVLCLLPIPVVVISVNFLVDPANIVQTKYKVEKEISNHILAGRNIAIDLAYADYDERVMHAFILKGSKEPLDVVVMGSSRARQIYKEDFPGSRFYNLASAAANLEDFLSYYYLVEDRGSVPSLLVLVMDHWMLDQDPGYTHWKALSDVFAKACSRMEIPVCKDLTVSADHQWRKFLEILSPAYFQQSLKRFDSIAESNAKQKDRVRPTEELWARAGEWLQKVDGSAGERQPAWTEDEVWEKVRTKDDGVSPLRSISNERERILTGFLDFVLKNGRTKVVLFLPPIHPHTYEIWVRQGKGIELAETYFRDLGQRYGLTVMGSYNAKMVGATPKDFTDWVHPRREIMKKLISGLKLSQARN